MSFGRTLEIIGFNDGNSRQYTLKCADLGFRGLTINAVLPPDSTWQQHEPKIFAMVAAGFGIEGAEIDEITVLRHGSARDDADAPLSPDAATTRFATV